MTHHLPPGKTRTLDPLAVQHLDNRLYLIHLQITTKVQTGLVANLFKIIWNLKQNIISTNCYFQNLAQIFVRCQVFLMFLYQLL